MLGGAASRGIDAMPGRQFACPKCNTQLRTAETVAPGTGVRCPTCGSTIRVPGEEFTPAPPPALPPRREAFTDTPPAPEEERDEFDRPDGPREGPGLEGLCNEYSIRIGDWFRYAQAHWGAVLGPMIGYALLLFLMIVGLVITCVGILALPFFGPALAAGFTVVGLAQLKGERWTFGDFFGGFRQFWPVVGGTWLVFVVADLWAYPGEILQEIGQAKYQAEANAQMRARPEANPNDPFAGLARAGQQQPLHPEDPVVFAGMMLRLIGTVVSIYFHVRCLFVLPLIIDRKCGPVKPSPAVSD
jgi:hypothetical protein